MKEKKLKEEDKEHMRMLLHINEKHKKHRQETDTKKSKNIRPFHIIPLPRHTSCTAIA